MATGGFVILDATVEVDGNDISELIKSVTVHREYADVDATGMRSGGAMEHLNGLRSDSFTFTAKSSFEALTGLDAIFEELFENSTEFEVSVKPHEGATTDENPAYVADVLLQQYDPIAGEIGALSTTELTLPCQGRIVKQTT